MSFFGGVARLAGVAPRTYSAYSAPVIGQIRRLLKTAPFRPFEIHTSRGEVFRVTHLETAAVLNRRVTFALPDGENAAMINAFHIVSVGGADEAVA